MKYLLDANICILLLGADNPRLAARVLQCEEGDLAVSAIAFAEIAFGSWNGKLPPLPMLDRFSQEVVVMPFDLAAAKKYADLPFKRGSFDRLIAAHALALDLTLVTDNVRHFSDVPALRVENWTL